MAWRYCSDSSLLCSKIFGWGPFKWTKWGKNNNKIQEVHIKPNNYTHSELSLAFGIPRKDSTWERLGPYLNMAWRYCSNPSLLCSKIFCWVHRTLLGGNGGVLKFFLNWNKNHTYKLLTKIQNASFTSTCNNINNGSNKLKFVDYIFNISNTMKICNLNKIA